MFRPLAQSRQEEWLDRPDLPPEELLPNLRDLGRINRSWGGNRSTLSALGPRLRSWPRGRPLRVLDVGAGGGDLLLALAQRCRRLGLDAYLVGLDRSGEILRIARGALAAFREIRLLRADALALPFPPNSFDFVVCSLVLHHVPPERAPEFLRGLASLALEGVVISDLRRGRWEYAATLLFTRTLMHGRMTRHDGPLSVLRAFTMAEARDLARVAGWDSGVVSRSFPMRLLMVDRNLKC